MISKSKIIGPNICLTMNGAIRFVC